ncbi:uncharacterized protein VTP21DRAFT_5771 [Calcarisporiella thermophila]|uniref:uncharacterized protein n=1 Tax=Calcarisporiella thermophila TaxID=911321 RepID=UPI0037429DCA
MIPPQCNMDGFVLSGYTSPKLEIMEESAFYPTPLTHTPSFITPLPYPLNCNGFDSSPSPEPLHYPSPSSVSYLHPNIASPSPVDAIRASMAALPEGYYPEFHQYNKDTYEQSTRNKRARLQIENLRDSPKSEKSSSTTEEEAANENAVSDKLPFEKQQTSQELRRQIHIQSEQKRRAQIKDGFEILRKQLPGCVNKKMSKATLLQKTVQHLQHLHRVQRDLLATADRIARENQELRSRLQEALLYTNVPV